MEPSSAIMLSIVYAEYHNYVHCVEGFLAEIQYFECHARNYNKPLAEAGGSVKIISFVKCGFLFLIKGKPKLQRIIQFWKYAGDLSKHFHVKNFF